MHVEGLFMGKSCRFSRIRCLLSKAVWGVFCASDCSCPDAQGQTQEHAVEQCDLKFVILHENDAYTYVVALTNIATLRFQKRGVGGLWPDRCGHSSGQGYSA